LRVRVSIEVDSDDAVGGIRRATELGIRIVGVRLRGALDFGEAVRNKGLELGSVIATEMPASAVATGREGIVQAWRVQLEQVRAAGGELLILPLDFAGSSARFDERLRVAMDALRGLRFAAERFGVRIAVRLGVALDVWAAEAVREFFDGVNSYWVGCEVTMIDSRSLEALTILTHRVAAIRIEQPGAWEAPDRAALAAALRAVDYDGDVIVADEPGAERIREALASCDE